MGFNMNDVNAAQESTGNFPRPGAGGYVMKVVSAVDVPDKQYYLLKFDYAEGQFKGYCQEQFTRWGNDNVFIKGYLSYKQTSLGILKHRLKQFTEANNGRFSAERAADNPREFVGKGIGVVLQEYEYIATKGNHQGEVMTGLQLGAWYLPNEIRNGDFKLLEKKALKQDTPSFQPVPDDNDVPF